MDERERRKRRRSIRNLRRRSITLSTESDIVAVPFDVEKEYGSLWLDAVFLPGADLNNTSDPNSSRIIQEEAKNQKNTSSESLAIFRHPHHLSPTALARFSSPKTSPVYMLTQIKASVDDISRNGDEDQNRHCSEADCLNITDNILSPNVIHEPAPIYSNPDESVIHSVINDTNGNEYSPDEDLSLPSPPSTPEIRCLRECTVGEFSGGTPEIKMEVHNHSFDVLTVNAENNNNNLYPETCDRVDNNSNKIEDERQFENTSVVTDQLSHSQSNADVVLKCHVADQYCESTETCDVVQNDFTEINSNVGKLFSDISENDVNVLNDTANSNSFDGNNSSSGDLKCINEECFNNDVNALNGTANSNSFGGNNSSSGDVKCINGEECFNNDVNVLNGTANSNLFGGNNSSSGDVKCINSDECFNNASASLVSKITSADQLLPVSPTNLVTVSPTWQTEEIPAKKMSKKNKNRRRSNSFFPGLSETLTKSPKQSSSILEDISESDLNSCSQSDKSVKTSENLLLKSDSKATSGQKMSSVRKRRRISADFSTILECKASEDVSKDVTCTRQTRRRSLEISTRLNKQKSESGEAIKTDKRSTRSSSDDKQNSSSELNEEKPENDKKNRKKEENLEQLYTNKNFKKPERNTWEKIFEEPVDGVLVGGRKLRRSLVFDTVTAAKKKQRQQKAAKLGWGGNRKQTKLDDDYVRDAIDKIASDIASID